MDVNARQCVEHGCEGWALPGSEGCLRHAREAEREGYYGLARRDHGTLADGRLTRLAIDQALAHELRNLLLHLPGASVDFRESRFESSIDFRGLHLGDARFAECRFGGPVTFAGSQFGVSADFTRTTFDDDVDFSGLNLAKARFARCRFRRQVTFAKTRFDGDARFDGSQFDGDADFRDTTFSTYGQSFRGARFQDLSFAWSGDADDKSRMMVSLHLSGAELPRGARFDRRHFGHPEAAGEFSVFLDDARVGGNLLFFDVLCDGMVCLDRVKLTAPITVLAPRGSRVSLTEATLTEPLTITTRVTGAPLAADDALTQLVSLQDATLEAPLVVGDGMALTEARMFGATGLDNLRITTVDPRWAVRRRRRVVAEELAFLDRSGMDKPDAPHPKQVEAIYRQLRAALEASKAAPAAADFYYGEMEMRRLSSARPSFDRTLLAVYKWTSGYGLRASRALLTYLLVLLGTTLLLRHKTDWFVASPRAAAGSEGLSFMRSWDVFAIAARSSVSFLSANTNGLTAAGTVLFILLRLLGPGTVALTILALRAKVQR